MNPQHTSNHHATPRPVSGEPEASTLSLVSACMDGADTDPDWLCALDSPEGKEAWHHYHLIGDVLRATSSQPFVASVAALSATQANASAARVVELARAAGTVVDAPAASAKVLPLPEAMPTIRHGARTTDAANDGVFRWKLVAGLASVVAVLGVVWGVSGVPGAVGQGTELALKATPVPEAARMQSRIQSADAAVQAPMPNVLVSTPSGDMLRDPRLEALLQAHRQAGGMSALQVPAGFLRNATFQSTQR